MITSMPALHQMKIVNSVLLYLNTQVEESSMLYQDPHYTLNEETGEITFDKTHRFYELERKAFALHGVDINDVTQVEHYDDLSHAFRQDISELFTEYVRNKRPTTLEGKHFRSRHLGDVKEADRLSKIIDKKHALKITVVK